MDRTISTTMIEDAEAVLGSIRRAVLLSLQDPSENGSLISLQEDAESLHFWAEEMRSDEFAASVEHLQMLIKLSETETSQQVKYNTLDAVSYLESLLVGTKLAADESSDEFLDAVDLSFRAFDDAASPAAADSDTWADEEIDIELLEVFAEEAEQLLSEFENQVKQLAADPADKNGLWEIRRIAHTFKGAAGAVGLKPATDFAHRLEDVLDKLANAPQPPANGFIQVFERSAATLRLLARGEGPKDIQNDAAYLELDDLLSGAKVQTDSAPAVSEFEKSNPAEAPAKKSVVRVSVAALDALDLHVRELAKNFSTIQKIFDAAPDAAANLRDNLLEAISSQYSLTEAIRNELHSIRMIEFGNLTTRFQRAVRVACEEEHKTSEILIQNSEVKFDTLLLDSLVEPIMHLLRNAVVHGLEPAETRRLIGKPESGMIRINVSESQYEYVIEISDDGRGMDANLLRSRAVELGIINTAAAEEMLDDPALELVFHKGLSTANKLTLLAGRGVGMSIVREAVENLNGAISIKSRKNTGTTFTIRLPKAATESHADEAVEKPELRILTIDDSASVRIGNRKAITAVGYVAAVAENGIDALAKLRNGEPRPDLIFTDLEMPEMDGFGFIEAIKSDENLREIPVVVVSSRTDPNYRTRALRLGADGCVEKPLNAQKVISVVNEILRI